MFSASRWKSEQSRFLASSNALFELILFVQHLHTPRHYDAGASPIQFQFLNQDQKGLQFSNFQHGYYACATLYEFSLGHLPWNASCFVQISRQFTCSLFQLEIKDTFALWKEITFHIWNALASGGFLSDNSMQQHVCGTCYALIGPCVIPATCLLMCEDFTQLQVCKRSNKQLMEKLSKVETKLSSSTFNVPPKLACLSQAAACLHLTSCSLSRDLLASWFQLFIHLSKHLLSLHYSSSSILTWVEVSSAAKQQVVLQRVQATFQPPPNLELKYSHAIGGSQQQT